MDQTLHLLVVDSERREAFVAWHGSRWLLPVLCVPERVRAGPVALRWLAENEQVGHVVGQWLGRAAPNGTTIDWLIVVRLAARPQGLAKANFRWTPLESLRSRALVDYQRWAVASALSSADLPAVLGPFGTMTWINEVQAWMEELRGPPSAYARGVIVPHRVTAYDVVLELQRCDGSAYFRGLCADRAPEARLAARLADIAPESFVRTLGQSTRPDGAIWWLVEGCPGSTLASSASRASVARVAATYARIQQRIANADDGLAFDLGPLDLSRITAWANALLAETVEAPHAVRVAGALCEACERVTQTRVPWSWVFADLDPTNVVVRGREIRFIDLDESVLGPAPLAVATFARRVRRLGITCGEELYQSYERAWHPALRIHDHWHDFEIVSELVECSLTWDRVVLKTKREEIRGVLDRARDRLAGRLTRAVPASAT